MHRLPIPVVHPTLLPLLPGLYGDRCVYGIKCEAAAHIYWPSRISLPQRWTKANREEPGSPTHQLLEEEGENVLERLVANG